MKKLILFTLILGSKLVTHAAANHDLQAALENNDEIFVSALLSSDRGQLFRPYNGMTLPDFLNSLPASNDIKQLVADCYLFYMVQNGSIEAIQNIINERIFTINGIQYEGLPPANVNALNPSNGVTPAMIASATGDANVLRALIAKGADVGQSMTDHQGNTALHHAASYGQDATLTVLLGSGLYHSVDPVNSLRETPLMFAAQYGAQSVIAALLAAGADKTLTNNEDHNALWFLDNARFHANMYLYERNTDGTVKRDPSGNLMLAQDPVLAHQALVDMLTP